MIDAQNYRREPLSAATACAAVLVAIVGTGCGLFGPPAAELQESYGDAEGAATFDHGDFDTLLARHVDAEGWVDYDGLAADPSALDSYIERLADAPFDQLGRDDKLALLINAYNAFTLRLILDHYPLDSIRDIPSGERWDGRTWRLAGNDWTLNQIEHEQIRPNFREPRIHFAVNCASVGCPPLRDEAYVGDQIERQLAEQTEFVHTDPRWASYEAGAKTVELTKLYDWYGGDFEQVAGSRLAFAAPYVEGLQAGLDGGAVVEIEYLDYDWSLNVAANAP